MIDYVKGFSKANEQGPTQFVYVDFRFVTRFEEGDNFCFLEYLGESVLVNTKVIYIG